MIKKASIAVALLAMLLGMASLAGRPVPGLSSQSASPDVGGTIVYARAGAIWDYSGGKSQQLTSGPRDKQDKRDEQPAISPDGTQVIYVRLDEGFSDLYSLNLANPSQAVALTNHRPDVQTGAEGYNTQALWAFFPAWSPGGDRIAYTTDVGTEYPGLYTMSPEGGGAKRLEFSLDRSNQGVERPSWSPDGGKIAVANYQTNGNIGQIWVLDLEAGRWLAISNSTDGAYDAAWSPDGEWIAFTMRDGIRNNIYVVPSDAQKWSSEYPTPVQLTTDGSSRAPAWSPDGHRLAYIGLHDGSFDIYAADFTVDSTGSPALSSLQKLTANADVDATSGLSWGK